MALAGTSLTEKRCRPCEGDEDPLGAKEAEALHQEVPDWGLGAKEIHRDLEFPDFRAAIRFVDQVAGLAEDEGHHPDLLVHDYKKVRVTLSTHAIGGLSENDFILAAKIDQIL